MIFRFESFNFPGTLPSSHTSIESQHSREGTSCHQAEEETSLPGEVTCLPGEVTCQPGEAISLPGETTVTTGEETSNVGEVIGGQEKEPYKACGSKSVCNIGTKVSLTDYAEREWRGNTPRAELMKKVPFFWKKLRQTSL